MKPVSWFLQGKEITAFTKQKAARRGSNESWCQQLGGQGTLFPMCYSHLAWVWHLHSYADKYHYKETLCSQSKGGRDSTLAPGSQHDCEMRTGSKVNLNVKTKASVMGKRGLLAAPSKRREGTGPHWALTPMAGSPRSGSSTPWSYRWKALFPANLPPGTLKRIYASLLCSAEGMNS